MIPNVIINTDMKINRIHIAATALALLAASASCSQDTADTPEPLAASRVYNDASGLELYLNGYPVSGKQAQLYADNGNGRLVLDSSVDFAQFGVDASVPGPGVLPGSPSTELEFKLNPSDGVYQFGGDGSSEFCTYDYEGYATPESLKLFLNDVRLKSGGISPQVWQPAPADKEGGPFFVDFNIDPAAGIDLDLTPVVEKLVQADILPVPDSDRLTSLAAAFDGVFRTFAFLPDGNVIVTYVNTTFGTPQFAQTLPNRVQYAVTGPGNLQVYADPVAMAGTLMVMASGGTPADEVDLTDTGLFGTGPEKKADELPPLAKDLLKGVIEMAGPLLSQGLSLHYAPAADGLDVYMTVKVLSSTFKAGLHLVPYAS